jgi:prepilin-type N-terminal cleavage/methylation domain-containing protein
VIILFYGVITLLSVRKYSKEGAFTLVELLCVVALLGMIMLVAMPALQDTGRKRNLEIAARTLATDMRRCQQAAITTGTPYCLEFLVYNESYHYRFKNCQTSKSERISFPEGVNYRSTTFRIDGGFPKLRFNPNGAPNFGGTVVLCNSADDILYVIVTPATGRVRISEDPPDHWEASFFLDPVEQYSCIY